jgi:hypothetical protein
MEMLVDFQVERRLLDMSLTQVELCFTNNTVHCVLNESDAKDPLLTSNEVQQLLSKTSRFLPTASRIQPSDYIGKARANAESAGIIAWKPKQFPYSSDFYAEYTKVL